MALIWIYLFSFTSCLFHGQNKLLLVSLQVEAVGGVSLTNCDKMMIDDNAKNLLR